MRTMCVWSALLLAACGAARAGDLTSRYERTLHRVLSGGPPRYTDGLVVADVIPRPVRRFTNFSGDVSGRYIGALSMASLDVGHSFEPLARIAAEVLQYQKPDGHFGNPMTGTGVGADDMAMLWGNGRLLIGLMEYYRLSKRPEILQAATRLGDFLVRVAPILNQESVRKDYSLGQFAVGYICWTQNIEGLVGLYRVTGQERYLSLAEQLAARTERHPAQHSHGFLTSLRGVLDLYSAMHEPKYLTQVEREWRGVIDSGNLLAQGAIPEAFYPNIRRDEGCSESDWLRLNLALWKSTGKLVYLEHAEQTLFNEFAFNQFGTGDFGHHALTETGTGEWAARAWWCCTLHGLRCFHDIFHSVFHARSRALYYDLPVDGRGQAANLRMTADSRLGKDGSVVLSVTESDGKMATLFVRKPKWADGIEAYRNETRLTGPFSDGYLRLIQHWRKGDSILLRYLMRTRVEQSNSGRVAIFYGPWLLGVDARLSPNFFDEPFSANRIALPRRGRDGDIDLERAPSAGSGDYTLPSAHFLVRYLPGGYPLQPDTAVLRPIAEQTGNDLATAWEFWFRVEKTARTSSGEK